MARKLRLVFRKFPQNQLTLVYRHLEQFHQKKGYFPSRVEVARKFNTHHQTVCHWYTLMVEAKMMAIIPGVARGIKLLPLQETTPQPMEAQ